VQLAASGIDRRNLRGRCGESRVGGRKPLTHRSSGRSGRLSRQGQASKYGTANKARASRLQSYLPSGWSSVTRGRLQAIHVVRRTPATRRVPGRRKASRLPRRRSPSRGTSRRGSRSAGMRKGLQPSENIPPDDHGVLDPPRRRGTSDALSLTARRREGPGTFAPGGSAHARTSTLPRPSSARPTVGSRRRLARGVSRSSVLRRPTSRRLAAAVSRRRRCGVARCLSSLGRGRAIARRAPREGRTGSEGQRTGTGGNTRKHEAGAREDRTLEVVLARRRCRCRSRQTVFGAENRTSLHFTRSGGRSGTGA